MISPRQDQVLRPAEPDDPWQPLRGAGAGNDAEPELRLAELRGIGRDTDVAGERKLAAAAERVTVDRGDRGPRKPLDLGEQRRVDRRQPVVTAAGADVVDVGARDERRLAGAGDDEHADLSVGAELDERAYGTPPPSRG